jgi:hypothetical protein
MRICFTIAGRRYCFFVPLLVELPFKKPPPENFPELELAATVLEMVRVVGPSELSKELSEAATRYISKFQKDLPKGVEIVTEGKTAG